VPGEQIQGFTGFLERLMYAQVNDSFERGWRETTVIQAGIFEDCAAFLARRADDALGWEFDLPEQPDEVNVGCAVFLGWLMAIRALAGKSSRVGCWRGFRGWW
jgi:hypothetical protein